MPIGSPVEDEPSGTLIAGARDGALPQVMQDIEARMPHATLQLIADAGHLPNIDQPRAFTARNRHQRQGVRVFTHLRAGMPQHGQIAGTPVVRLC